MNDSLHTCPLCGRESCRATLRLTSHRVYRCGVCGYEFNADFPPAETAGGSFTEEYYHGLQSEAFARQVVDPNNDPSFRFYSRALDALEARVAGRRLLDVGPGLGAFMKIACDRGWTPEGSELSEYGVSFIRKTYGFTVHQGDVTEAVLPGGYDVITFWDSLEHVADPKANLAAAHRLLAPGGLLFVSTDNYAALIPWLARGIYLASAGRVRYAADKIFIPHNRSYFTENRLMRFITESGFAPLLSRRMEYPLSKLNVSPVEKVVLALLYAAGWALRRPAQCMIIARRV